MIQVQFGYFTSIDEKINISDFLIPATSIYDLWKKAKYSLYVNSRDDMYFESRYKARKQLLQWGYRELERNVLAIMENGERTLEVAVICCVG